MYIFCGIKYFFWKHKIGKYVPWFTDGVGATIDVLLVGTLWKRTKWCLEFVCWTYYISGSVNFWLTVGVISCTTVIMPKKLQLSYK